jgi:hypothetical protein
MKFRFVLVTGMSALIANRRAGFADRASFSNAPLHLVDVDPKQNGTMWHGILRRG